MRFVKAMLVVLLVLTSSLLLIGVFMPEVDFTVKTTVERPSVAIFASVIDPSTLPQWIEELESVERESGILSFPGSTFQLTMKEKETVTTYLMEVVEIMPVDKLKVRLTNDNAQVDATMKLLANGADTDVELYVQIKGSDLLSRAFIALMQSSIKDQTQNKLDALKRLQEQH
jgi:hypothetical protein